MGSDVATVVVGGKVVIEDRRPLTIDVDGLYREIRAFCAKGLTPEQRTRADLLARVKPHAQTWYAGWHDGLVDRPFYRVNSRAEPAAAGALRWLRRDGRSGAESRKRPRCRSFGSLR